MKGKNWFDIALNAAGPDTAEVRIYDDIGAYGVSAKQFCEQFAAIKAAKIDLRINSYGGEVFDAAAICTAIREHTAEVTAHVDGIAASAASVVAAACDATAIGKSAFMMIHNPLVMAFGNADELRKQADVLDKLGGSIAQVYCDKTGKSMADVKQAMDDETWFDSADALKWGLADSIKEDDDDDDAEDRASMGRGLGRAINSIAPLLVRKFKNVPEPIRLAAQRPTSHGRPKEAENMAHKIIARDGKHFVNLDGKEHEVEAPTLPVAAAPKSGKSDEEVAAAVSQAKADAVKAEREYRSMFGTIVATAGLAGEAAEKFEKAFYGRAETDLKFLASHAIGARATAIGEGGGAHESQQEKKDEAEKQKAEILTYCAGRFAKEPSLRRQFKCNSGNPEDPVYKAALEKFIAVESKSRADWARKPSAADDEPQDDHIARLAKNKSVFTMVR